MPLLLALSQITVQNLIIKAKLYKFLYNFNYLNIELFFLFKIRVPLFCKSKYHIAWKTNSWQLKNYHELINHSDWIMVCWIDNCIVHVYWFSVSCDSFHSFLFSSENGHCADPTAMQATAQHERVDIWKLPLKQNVDVEAEVTKLSLENILGEAGSLGS